MSSDPSPATPSAADRRRDRIFLVVVDDSPERDVALRYACLRALKGGGRVALLRVAEPPGMSEWAGVGALLRQERREEAERLLSSLAAEVNRITGTMPILFVREGHAREELLKLLEEEVRISILVLASSPAGEGPGPLITALAGKYSGRLKRPMTIVPGGLGEAELDAVT
ncbi:MAG: universal stress protein [Acetobacteraceae bacterium]|nr:universal stress protein [Acetobacteraceae bacterium]